MIVWPWYPVLFDVILTLLLRHVSVEMTCSSLDSTLIFDPKPRQNHALQVKIPRQPESITWASRTFWSHIFKSSHCDSFEDRAIHDDVIKWKHFPRYWPFVREIHRSPVNLPHKGQWRGALMFSFDLRLINGWVNNRKTGDLRRYRAHYDVMVMVDFILHWVGETWQVRWRVVAWRHLAFTCTNTDWSVAFTWKQFRSEWTSCYFV